MERYSSSIAAIFFFLTMLMFLLVSCLKRLNAIFLNTLKAKAPVPLRIRDSSSLNVISNIQCMLSTCQWLLIASNACCALRGNELIYHRVSSDFLRLNFSSTVPQILENAENIDLVLFLDAANLWGVDYDSSLDECF